MIEVIVPKHLKNKLKKKQIKEICKLSLGEEKYTFRTDKRGPNSGQYIKLKYDDNIKYICLSGPDCTVSRNSFILQNFPSAYHRFLMEKNPKKSFAYYIRDVSKPHAPYIIFSYKVLLTAGIEILNLNQVIPSSRTNYDLRTPFYNFKQMRKFRVELQSKNSGNSSTLFEELSDEIAVYGKTYGANGRETTAICLALSKLSNLPIKVYNVNETDPSHRAKVDRAERYILEDCGIKIDDGSMDFEKDENGVAKRDTKRYHYNLLQKFGEKKCYLCGCDIESLIIGSHIKRVADILSDKHMKESEKQAEIIDGDNGFWLCANHDKLFEYGLIFFKEDILQTRNHLTDLQHEFIYESTFSLRKIYACDNEKDENIITNKEGKLGFKISPNHYTIKMHKYLECHKARTDKLKINKKNKTENKS